MRVAIAVMVLALASCDNGTGLTSRLTADDLEGTWTFMLDDGAARCTPDYNEPFALYLFISNDLTVLSSGAVNVVGHWARARDREFDWPATGNMNVQTGTVELHFWWTDGINGPQIRLSGTLEADGPRITGTWSETDGSINYTDAGCSGSFQAEPE